MLTTAKAIELWPKLKYRNIYLSIMCQQGRRKGMLVARTPDESLPGAKEAWYAFRHCLGDKNVYNRIFTGNKGLLDEFIRELTRLKLAVALPYLERRPKQNLETNLRAVELWLEKYGEQHARL